MGGKGSKTQKTAQEIFNSTLTETCVNVLNKTTTENNTITVNRQDMNVANIECDELNINQTMGVEVRVLTEITEANLTELESAIENKLDSTMASAQKSQSDPLNPLATMLGELDQETDMKLRNEVKNIIKTNLTVDTVTRMITSTKNEQNLVVGIPDVTKFSKAAEQACSGIKEFKPRVPPRNNFYFPTDNDFAVIEEDVQVFAGSSSSYSGSGGSGTVNTRTYQYKSDRVTKLYDTLLGIGTDRLKQLFDEIYEENPNILKGVSDVESEKSTIQSTIQSNILARLSGSMDAINSQYLMAYNSADADYQNALETAKDKCKDVQFFQHVNYDGYREDRNDEDRKLSFSVFDLSFHNTSSVKVPDGCDVTIFSEPGGGGKSYSFSSDQSYMPPGFNDKVKSARVTTKEISNLLQGKVDAEANLNNKQELTVIEKKVLSELITKLNSIEEETRLMQIKAAADADVQVAKLYSECVDKYTAIGSGMAADLASKGPVKASMCNISQDMQVSIVATMISSKITSAIMDSEVVNGITNDVKTETKDESSIGTISEGIQGIFGALTSGPMLALLGFFGVLFLIFMLLKAGVVGGGGGGGG